MKTDHIHIIICTLAALLAGCHDTPDAAPGGGGDIMVDAGMETSLQWRSGRGSTTIPGVVPETIGVFAEIRDVSGGVFSSYYINVFDNQLMYNPEGEAVQLAEERGEIDLSQWSDGAWPYTPVKKWDAGTYNFYCYAPYLPGNAEWIPGPTCHTFKLHRIPPLSATEYSVGRYLINKEVGNNPSLTLTHITSRLRFLFAVSEKYSELRIIRLTSIKISDTGDGTPYWECSVALDRTDPETPVDLEIEVKPSATNYVSTGDIELIAENDDVDPAKPGQRLTTDYQPFTSAYNLLGTIAYTNLTVVYDVYDKTDQLLRKDQTVTNRVKLSDFGALEAGKCYDVKIMVSPKYLYVLSDNDVLPDAVIEPLTP